VLEVQDDGQGFQVPRRWLELARQGHLGLVGIAERAEAIGGQLQIISAPGAGTRIRVVVPNTSAPESVVPLDDPTDHQHRDQPEVL
jgi:signal transduction histidine kinase